MIRTAPNGDVFVAESDAGDIKVFRGITPDSRPERVEVFASGLTRPYGIGFYPPGNHPKWVYIGNTDAVVRFPYQNGDLKARGALEHIVNLPSGVGHWTRSVEFSKDGKRCSFRSAPDQTWITRIRTQRRKIAPTSSPSNPTVRT